MNHHEDEGNMDKIAPNDASKVVNTQISSKNISNLDIFSASLK